MTDSPETPQSPTTPGSPQDEDSSPSGPDEALASGHDAGSSGSVDRSSRSAETTGSDGGTTAAPEEGLIPDEQLPEDLQPAKNPLAADPDDHENGGTAGPGGPDPVAAAPGGDMGQPG